MRPLRPPTLTSHLPKIRDTNLKHLMHFWKALGLYFDNLIKTRKYAKFQICMYKNKEHEVTIIKYTFLKSP